ncbi:hypothetical protein pb186bvf_004244 [Paramecium bursaria]
MLYHNDFIKLLKVYDNEPIAITESNQILIGENQLQQGSNIYDVLRIDNQFIVSQRDMPLLIYDYETLKLRGQILDTKEMSETLLNPLEIKFREDTRDVIGCGKGFIHSYNLQTNKIHKLRCINKTEYGSCLDVSIINQNHSMTKDLVLVGYFNKLIKIIDTKEDKIISEARIHIGGVTQVSFDKYNSLYFHSCARQDDLVYTWDIRNTSTFIQYMKRSNNTNQRVQFSISDKCALLGNDDGTCSLYKDNQIASIQICDTKTCVHSVHIEQDIGWVAYGQRSFGDEIHQTGIRKINLA